MGTPEGLCGSLLWDCLGSALRDLLGVGDPGQEEDLATNPEGGEQRSPLEKAFQRFGKTPLSLRACAIIANCRLETLPMRFPPEPPACACAGIRVLKSKACYHTAACKPLHLQHQWGYPPVFCALVGVGRHARKTTSHAKEAHVRSRHPYAETSATEKKQRQGALPSLIILATCDESLLRSAETITL